VIDADADLASIGSQIVDAIGHRPARLLDEEIMHPHLFGITLRPPFPASILEVSDKLLLLRVNRDNRLLFGQRAADARVDVSKLRIPIRMAVALSGFAVSLQTEFLALEQFANGGVAGGSTRGEISAGGTRSVCALANAKPNTLVL
jgi:hypothetical protein